MAAFQSLSPFGDSSYLPPELQLPLFVEAELPNVRRDIQASRPNGERHIIRVAQVSHTASRGHTHTDTFQQYFDLHVGTILPLYTVLGSQQGPWDIAIRLQGGTQSYPFQTRRDAFEFQQFLTGFQPIKHFEQISCHLTYESNKFRNKELQGVGEIQLWLPDKGALEQSVSVSRDSASSREPQSPRLTVSSSSSGSASIMTVERDERKRQTVVVRRQAPTPQLVAFLKHVPKEDKKKSGKKKARQGYTLLKVKMNAMEPEIRVTGQGAMLKMIPSKGSHFSVEHVSAAGEDEMMRTWNIGSRANDHESTLKCTQLYLERTGSGQEGDIKEIEWWALSLRKMWLEEAKRISQTDVDQLMAHHNAPEVAAQRDAQPQIPEQASLRAPSATSYSRSSFATHRTDDYQYET